MTLKGEATLTDAQAADRRLQAGKWYFNIHTEKNKGGGEIRGQVMQKGIAQRSDERPFLTGAAALLVCSGRTSKPRAVHFVHRVEHRAGVLQQFAVGRMVGRLDADQLGLQPRIVLLDVA